MRPLIISECVFLAAPLTSLAAISGGKDLPHPTPQRRLCAPPCTNQRAPGVSGLRLPLGQELLPSYAKGS